MLYYSEQKGKKEGKWKEGKRKKDRKYLRVRNFLKVIQKVNYKSKWKPSSSHIWHTNSQTALPQFIC